MVTPYRFASVNDDDGSDKSEVVFTPPGSDESGPPHSNIEASTLMEGSMYELVNMFGVDDSYPDVRVSREDAAQYANLLQDTINAFDAILDDSSGVRRISNHRRQLLQDYRDDMYHRCREVKDYSVVPVEYLDYLDDDVNLGHAGTEMPNVPHGNVKGKYRVIDFPEEQPLTKNKASGPIPTYTATETQEEQRSMEELMKSNYFSLSPAEKARVLVPLIQNLDPMTGRPFPNHALGQDSGDSDVPSGVTGAQLSTTQGSDVPIIDQTDTIQNVVEHTSLELPSPTQVPQPMSIHHGNSNLEEEPSASVRRPTLPQLGPPPRELTLTKILQPVFHALKQDDCEVPTSRGVPEDAEEEEKARLQLAHTTRYLRATLAAFDGASPSLYQRAYRNYRRLLPKVDKTDDIDTESASWKEMEQFKVVATVNDATPDQVTLGLPPKPDTTSPTNVDTWSSLKVSSFGRKWSQAWLCASDDTLWLK